MTKKSSIRPWWWNEFEKGFKEGVEMAGAERLISESSDTFSEALASKEFEKMNIEQIEVIISGTRYRLVPISSGESPKADGISGLTAGQFAVDLAAKVIKDWNLNIFTRTNDGTEGRVHSLLVGDETGTIKVALWDSHTEAVANIKVGDTLIISNGYTKKGLVKDGKQYIELHAGTKSTVVVVPKEEE